MSKKYLVEKIICKREDCLSMAHEFRAWAEEFEKIAQGLEIGEFYEPKYKASPMSAIIRNLYSRYRKLKQEVIEIAKDL